jgi:hypothetical protein
MYDSMEKAKVVDADGSGVCQLLDERNCTRGESCMSDLRLEPSAYRYYGLEQLILTGIAVVGRTESCRIYIAGSQA